MSANGRDFRPLYHYTPPFGWTNDPNGLTFEDGTWHLFAQHYPHDTHWGPMHWRHATSADLLHWKDEGIAMVPDEKLGFIFSGSAVIDRGNTSGLGRGGDPMVLMYTHHGEHEQQSIAFSDDRMHFTPYAGNPVIPNAEKRNFRDPKVFRNDILDCWTVAVAAGDRVEFYASDDLIHWRRTGDFGAAENRLPGVFECPDLFPLTAPDGGTVWVLVVSMAMAEEAGSCRMQYFLGTFDGETFHETIPAPYPRMMDSGYDNYAAVSFHNAEKRIMMGWAEVPAYANQVPTEGFKGSMTYAREMTLADTEAGLVLAAKPVTPAFGDVEIAPEPAPDPLPRWPLRYVPKAEGALPGEVFHVRVEAPAGFRLTLSNDDGEAVVVSISNEQCLVVDRSRAGIRGFSELYDSGLGSVMTARRTRRGPVTVDVYFDRMMLEVFADGGTANNSSVVYPKAPYTKATLLGPGRLWIGGARE